MLQELLRRAAQDEQAAVHAAKLAASAAVGAPPPPSDSEAAAQPLALAASISSQVRGGPVLSNATSKTPPAPGDLKCTFVL